MVGFLVLPWYGVEDGFFSFRWITAGFPTDPDLAPAIFLIGQGEKLWLAPLLLPLLGPLLALRLRKTEPAYAYILLLSGTAGLVWLTAQGFGIGIRGWNFGWLEEAFGQLGDRQFGMGYGGLVVASAFLILLSMGIAARGAVNGDVFVVGSIAAVVVTVVVFIFFPIARMFTAAFITEEGSYSVLVFLTKFFDDRLWGFGCLGGSGRCGAAWNSLFLAIVIGVITTVLGLACALVVARTGFRFKRSMRLLTVLPIITPPFVIGLALILLFGLSGSVTEFVAGTFGGQPTRWLYGLPGLVIAQTLAFTPIAFLVLIGVVEGVSPSMEEAAQTLRANRWQVFRTVSLPLMRPGLANAFPCSASWRAWRILAIPWFWAEISTSFRPRSFSRSSERSTIRVGRPSWRLRFSVSPSRRFTHSGSGWEERHTRPCPARVTPEFTPACRHGWHFRSWEWQYRGRHLPQLCTE